MTTEAECDRGLLHALGGRQRKCTGCACHNLISPNRAGEAGAEVADGFEGLQVDLLNGIAALGEIQGLSHGFHLGLITDCIIHNYAFSASIKIEWSCGCSPAQITFQSPVFTRTLAVCRPRPEEAPVMMAW